MTRLFVTGTGTDVGKTFVTAFLARWAVENGVSVSARKPLASGVGQVDILSSDPGILLQAARREVTPQNLNDICPWHYVKPVAPYLAAHGENREVPYGDVVDYSREILKGPEKLILIEGVGGVMAPVDRSHTVLDWIAALGIPVLLVAGTYVGTISHTLSALGALRAAKIRTLGIILNETKDSLVEPAEQAAAISHFASGVPLHVLPYVSGDSGWQRASCPSLVDAVLGRQACASPGTI